MKYTIKDLAEGRCAVIHDGTLEELHVVLSLAEGKLCDPIYGTAGSRYFWNGSHYWSNSDTNLSNLPTQSVKDFLVEDKSPEKWALNLGALTGEEKEQFLNWLPDDEFFKHYSEDTSYFHYPTYNVMADHDFVINYHTEAQIEKGYIEITFEQFKQQYLNKTMGKVIIGYKLVKPEYSDAALKITGGSYFTTFAGGFGFWKGSMAYDKIQQAGVLDLWFEPVYKTEEKIINMGSFELKVTAKGISHKSSDITQYVKGIFDTYCDKNYNQKGFAGYDFIVEDILLRKTGCEESPTKVSQWLMVWQEYKRLSN